MTHCKSRTELRQIVRQSRRALSADEQACSARLAAQRMMALPQVIQAKNLALFLSFDGELNTAPLIHALWQAHKAVYLPVLHPFSRGNLLFLRYNENTPLIKNRLNIMEPRLDVRQVLPVSQLDVLVTPLVAFDSEGQRLGMGGGFYDRTMQNRQQHHFYPVGLAHDCQWVPELPVEAWDIPLPAVVTPSRLWQWQ
ncbi:5-formyltetrahydrofolate cyclo-ligase [Citrobacter sp. JGM124]|uniref:5-formyltetrahydrofolate cyclo-ligase n=1 Tax=Citrobacter sp. JGM124 TaxID=2799789 RepID=UPI001BA7DEE4|nr:5-formyltetrahydrofolate cyclo-ligase [Citrobacter sp. JGM124]MBS0849343.1 5-formyltetrahydrofolate cyclo-ligase [Citrobacter sp. JGM124]